MKPFIGCHMLSSVDGRIVPRNWRVAGTSSLFESTAAKIKVDAWLVGRTTMQEFSSRKPRKTVTQRTRIARTDFVAQTSLKTFAVAIDPEGKCNWESESQRA
jgi:hypothetical protein